MSSHAAATEVRQSRLVLDAAFAPAETARTAWVEWTTEVSLDDTPAWVIPILPAIGANLADGAPVADSPRLSGLLRREWYISSRTTTRYEAARDLLINAGIEASLAGGFAHASSWPTPSARKLADATLVVKPHALFESLRLLRTAGYQAPECTEPTWHQAIQTISPDGEHVSLTGWLLGPLAVGGDRELKWRASLTGPRFEPDDLLIMALGRRILRPAAEPDGLQWRADVETAIAAGALTRGSFASKANGLGIGALAADLLRRVNQQPIGVDSSGAREMAAWRQGTKRQHLWHHPRLAAASGRRFGPGSYLTYRRHLAQHGPA